MSSDSPDTDEGIAKPILEVDFGEYNGGIKKFWSIDDVENWIKLQKDSWSWLSSNDFSAENQQQREHKSVLWNEISRPLAEIESHVQLARATEPGSPDYKNCIDSIRGNLEHRYSSNKLLTSDSPRTNFVNSWASKDHLVALYVLAYFLGRGVFPENQKSIHGSFEALCFNAGIAGTDSEKQALVNLHKLWSNTFNNYQQELETLKTQFETTKTDINDLKEKKSTQFKTLEGAINNDFESLKKTYLEDMKLRGPVDYWSKKSKKHGVISLILSVSLIVWLIVPAWNLGTIYSYASEIASNSNQLKTNTNNKNPAQKADNPKPKKQIEKDKPSNNTDFQKLAIFALLVTIYIWVGRILVRILFSQLHLRTDAEERAVMVNTYLALHSEGKMNDGNLQTIIESLFRQSSTGILKDEALPPGVLEAITRKIK